jgi:O-antigen/teichoic acid export membrane protein
VSGPTIPAPLSAPAPSPIAAPAAPGVGRRALKPAVWSTAGFGLTQLLRLVSNLVLTRFLAPDDYGVMAVATAVFVGLTLFSELGTSVFVVQHPQGADERFYNTAWTVNVIRGAVLWLITGLLAVPLATWYDAPALQWVVPAVGAMALINGCISTSVLILTRRIDPARVVVINVLATLVNVGAAMAWVLCVRANVWGFVIGNLASSLVLTVGSHFLLPDHRNRFCWDPAARAELWRLGKWVFLSTVLTFFAEQADRLIVGKYAGLKELGFYHLASQLCSMPLQLLATLGASILFPMFSEYARGGHGLSGKVNSARNLFQFAGTAGLIVLLVTAPSLVRLLFGARFEGAGWMVQVLAVGAFFKMFGTVGDNLFKALGKPQQLVVINLVKTVALVVLVPAGALAGGLPGLLAGLVAADVVRYLVSSVLLAREGVGGFRNDALLILVLVGAVLLCALV